MPQATPGQARVVDPILSAVARGYRSPKAAVANVLFPIVTVGLRAGRIISFGPDDFKLVIDPALINLNFRSLSSSVQ